MSWTRTTIGALGRVVTGKTPPTNNREFYDGEYPFVTPTDLDWQSYVVRKTHSSVTELARDRNRNQFIPADATMFTCIGNTIGKCGISAIDCLTNQQINSVVPNQDHDPKFIYYLLNYNRPQIRSIGIGNGAAQPIINKTVFSGVQVLVPPSRDDERRISVTLSAYDDLIDNNRRRIALLEDAARQLYKEWFVRFRFPGHEHVKVIDGLPDGWERLPLSSICTRITDGSHASPKAVDDGFPMASVKDMEDWRLDLSSCRQISHDDYESLVRYDCKPLKGDVLIAKDGSYLKHCFVVQDDIDVVILSSIAILRPNERIDPFLLAFTLKDPKVKEMMAGYVSGVALPRIILRLRTH